MKGTFSALITFILTSTLACSSFAADNKDTLRVLFVGNSYTYFENLPHLVSIISNGAKTQLVTKKSTLGGAKLSEHWRGERGLKTKEIISRGKFEIVVLQEHSMGTLIEKDSVKKYVKLFCDLIRSRGAKPYIYQTWARENAPKNQGTISMTYQEIATSNNSEVVPVGNAWALAKELWPEIKLYDPDGSHPSKFGTFLAACVFTKAILHNLPSWIPNSFKIEDKHNESVMLMNVDTAYVTFCRKITEKVVADGLEERSSQASGIDAKVKSTIKK
jgi:hypothetical protein